MSVQRIEDVPIEVLKRRAYGRIKSQIKAGLMQKPELCAHCGVNPGRGKDGRSLLQAHHHKGYLLPLEVEWICVNCHRKETPCNPHRGEACVQSKLTEADVRLILTSAESAPSLGAKLGVSPSRLVQIRNGKGWPHVVAALFAGAGR